MRYLLLTVIAVSCLHTSRAASPLDYSGENLLKVIGTSTASREFKEFKQYWWLDKNYENQEHGIKIFINPLDAKAEGVLLAGENFEWNGTKFLKCSFSLPYGILWEDDTAALNRKMGNGLKLLGRNTMKYHRESIGIEVSYSDLKKGSITSLKFYYEEKPFVPLAEDPTPEKKESLIKIMREETRAQVQALPEVTFQEEPVCDPVNCSPFKKSILNVFEAYRASNFNSVKLDEQQRGNYWNYKHTYTSKLSIPGERYNMLYSFPFADSQLDFVSVIKESDSYDKSFESAYREFEKKLKESFPESEGWTTAESPNKGARTLSDLEFRNNKQGSVILDYCKNPQGRHILFLRFLLFSE